MLVALVLEVGGCAAASRGRGASPAPAAPPAPAVNLDLEPVRVEVTHDARGGTRVEAFDARELFDQAGAELAADRYERALALYDRLVSAFPESQLVPPAIFNGGLALEGEAKLDAAVGRYLDVARRVPGTRYGIDAHIRAGAVMAELSRWGDALRLFDELIARGDLGAADRVEVHARRGCVLVASKRYPEAESSLAAALDLAQRSSSEQHSESSSFVAMAHYYLAEIPRQQAEAVLLRLPEQQLQRDLEARAKLVLVAQQRFEDTIRSGDLYWATAAGYQLGEMQLDMWRALVAAPVPPRLKADEATIYVAEVHQLARGHLEKALAAHETNREVADRNKAQNPWTDGSRRRVAEIHQLLAGAP